MKLHKPAGKTSEEPYPSIYEGTLSLPSLPLCKKTAGAPKYSRQDSKDFKESFQCFDNTQHYYIIFIGNQAIKASSFCESTTIWQKDTKNSRS